MHDSFKDLLKMYNINQREFAEIFGIPFRTVQGWAEEKPRCKEWMMNLFDHALKTEYRINE